MQEYEEKIEGLEDRLDNKKDKLKKELNIKYKKEYENK
jgi:hypothetical protein